MLEKRQCMGQGTQHGTRPNLSNVFDLARNKQVFCNTAVVAICPMIYAACKTKLQYAGSLPFFMCEPGNSTVIYYIKFSIPWCHLFWTSWM